MRCKTVIFTRWQYSNGDGIGDLQGIIQKLDYLNDGDPTTSDDLGVTGLWLMPIMESPSYHGYDAVDYRAIEADYGTREDFLALVEAAHARGMVVIVDLMLNHTSTAHPWFVAAAANPDSDYADWYIWTDDPPAYRGPWGQQLYHPSGDQFYYGIFWSGMPDLNYDNPDVTAEMLEISRFWLEDMNADGFRLDAIKHLFEEGRTFENMPETHAWLETYHDYVKSVEPGALLVGEIWSPTREVVEYVPDKVDIAFEFSLAEAILRSVDTGSKVYLRTAYQVVLRTYPPGQFATFLTNHDQNRVMSQFDQDAGKAQVAATLLLTSPGVPFIYYGEEIGMIGEKPDERIRTPMQWTADPATAGFTIDDPWQALQTNLDDASVAHMQADPDSLLNHYRTLIHLRNTHPALQVGTMIPIETTHPAIYAFVRQTDDETLLLVVNLSRQQVSDFTLDMSPVGTFAQAERLFGRVTVDAPGSDPSLYMPAYDLPGYSSLIIHLR